MPSFQYGPCGDGAMRHLGEPSAFTTGPGLVIGAVKALYQNTCWAMWPCAGTGRDARRAVAAVRYPPQGIRGVSLATRANRYGRDADYGQCANEEVGLLVQLETPKALENLETIAAVEGIDGIFVGPADLAATMGHLGNVRHAAVQAAIHDARERAHRCGKPIGILMADPELNARYIADGFDYVAVATDISLMRSGAEAALKQARSHQR